MEGRQSNDRRLDFVNGIHRVPVQQLHLTTCLREQFTPPQSSSFGRRVFDPSKSTPLRNCQPRIAASPIGSPPLTRKCERRAISAPNPSAGSSSSPNPASKPNGSA
jgi:hypothetical protein